MIKSLPLSKVRPGMVAADFVFPLSLSQPIINPNTLLTTEVIERLRMHGIYSVPVKIDDEYLIRENLLPDVEPLLSDELKIEAESGIRRLFETVAAEASDENYSTAHQVVKELDNVVDQLVDTLEANPHEMVRIADLKSYDDYTYHHSLSVAVLSIAIGQSMGCNQDTMRLIGRSAIMHDIGKMFVPIEIINKPSRLTDDEFAKIKEHPRSGYEYLVAGGIGDDAIRKGVLQHHEKIDGTGYPDGVTGNEMLLISNVISVADVYDAVTSYRSYRTPMPPADALELIMGSVGVAFEYDIVKAFIDKLEFYPVNTCVELSNSRVGIVLDNKSSMRPILSMLDNGEVLDLMDRKNLSIVIKRVVNDRLVADSA